MVASVARFDCVGSVYFTDRLRNGVLKGTRCVSIVSPMFVFIRLMSFQMHELDRKSVV